jgi:hypothetical protein
LLEVVIVAVSAVVELFVLKVDIAIVVVVGLNVVVVVNGVGV